MLADFVVRNGEVCYRTSELPELYEIVDGKIQETSPMTAYAGHVANRVGKAIIRYLFTNDIGECGMQLLFRIPHLADPTRSRRPDSFFVSYQRWPRSRPHSATALTWDVIPELAVEVVSLGDNSGDLIAKAREYLRGGVRLVWLIYPLSQEVHAYLPGAREIKVYFATDELDAGDVLPGFKKSVADLFPPVEPPPAPQPDAAA